MANDGAKPRILFLGHSFVRRLDEAFRRGSPLLNMDLHQCRLQMHGRGGASVLDVLHKDILNSRSVVKRFRPQVVVLQIGGNSLCTFEASVVQEHIMRVVEALLGLHFIRRVVILQVFARRRPRYVSREVYEERREELNTFLATRLTMPDLRERTTSWDHRRLENSPLAIFHDDGVHLSRSVGIPKYWRVVRGAIIHALAKLGSGKTFES